MLNKKNKFIFTLQNFMKNLNFTISYFIKNIVDFYFLKLLAEIFKAIFNNSPTTYNFFYLRQFRMKKFLNSIVYFILDFFKLF